MPNRYFTIQSIHSPPVTNLGDKMVITPDHYHFQIRQPDAIPRPLVQINSVFSDAVVGLGAGTFDDSHMPTFVSSGPAWELFQPIIRTTPMFPGWAPEPNPLYGDSLRIFFTGAASDGAAQASQAASLGNYRSSTEATRVGALYSTGIFNLTIQQMSRSIGGDGTSAQVLTATPDKVKFFADAASGPALAIANGETRVLYDPDSPSKWVRVRRTASNSLQGNITFECVDQFNNVFGMSDIASTGGNRYRAVMIRNDALASVTGITFTIEALATATTCVSGLGGAGSGTITAASNGVCGWPQSGWCRIVRSGTLIEIVYYSSRTDTVLTVPTGGRGRLGTSAAAGAASDVLTPVPGIRFAYENPSPMVGGNIQTIASESTAPTGVTWDARTISYGSLMPNQQVGLWIHRETPTSDMLASGKILNLLSVTFTVGGVQYTEKLAGLYRCSNTSLELYELRIGVGAKPALTDAPNTTSATLPLVTGGTPLASDGTYYLGVDRRNKYNMLTQTVDYTQIVVSSNATLTNPPTSPQDIRIDPAASGAFRIRAVYPYVSDLPSLIADTWLIYFTSTGVDPVVPTDLLASPSITQVDGFAYLDYTTTTFAGGTIGKVLVRVRRTGSPNRDSTNTTVYSATADAAGPSAPDVGGFWVKNAEGP